ncbi:MAG: hypothetical protein FWE31_02535 [Firmicutes bacterium]|nr:hypothetical protein [Bacillota bacterium]
MGEWEEVKLPAEMEREILELVETAKERYHGGATGEYLIDGKLRKLIVSISKEIIPDKLGSCIVIPKIHLSLTSDGSSNSLRLDDPLDVVKKLIHFNGREHGT